jgi:lipopolysaccharide biosynthesis regulator YciM
MDAYGPLLAALLALLAGLTIGKAWERYKLREGRWIDRRKAAESPHFILGLNFLVSNQIDLAIDELNRAAAFNTDALEIHLILGNLYREKGQVGRAIQIHQQLLQRPKLRRLEHVYILLSLGLDFRRGGFVDRALEAFNEVLRLDPKNEYALLNLQKLYEEQHQWREAYRVRQEVGQIGEGDHRGRDRAILAFLENELGMEAAAAGRTDEALQHYQAAIDLDGAAVPAYLNLGDVLRQQGRLDEAVAAWEEVLKAAPERAYLVFDRLEALYPQLTPPRRFPDLCRRMIAASRHDWRARLALARHLAASGSPNDALELLFEALLQNPHSLTLHQAIWRTLSQLGLQPSMVGRYIDLTRRAVFYLDPHICLRCRYRSTELLWQCPQCHEWNTFVEERIAPAKDGEEMRAS